jgi:regulator of PEP synthase PpsR (kinase-PPPase family)
MKKLKVTLSDGKDYTFGTFSILEQQALKKRFKDYMKTEEEQNKIRFEYDNENKVFKKDAEGNLKPRVVDDESEKKLEEYEEKSIVFMIDIVRKSICKFHPEFKKKENKEEDNLVVEQLKDMFDLSDLRDITFFAFNGIYVEKELVIDVTLSKDPTNETAK